jgi:RNA polymerase sigma factor (sigma-70 family)
LPGIFACDRIGADRFITDEKNWDEVTLDNRGVSALFMSYAPEVRRHIANRLTCNEDVEDLVQEVFLRAMRSPAGREIAHPRAYLYRIASNAISDYFRRQLRRRMPPSGVARIDEERELANPCPTPEESAICDQTWERLRAAIDCLPRKAKRAIILRKLEDLSCIEVAESMGISIRTLEKHLARGLRNLRASIDA